MVEGIQQPFGACSEQLEPPMNADKRGYQYLRSSVFIGGSFISCALDMSQR
jgi:hypothetical protein